MHHHHPTTSSSSTLQQSTQQPPTQRRRKKRPNYGTRTVEVRRGYSGFGFTISGQQPCRLSCIIPNSPADQAGLRAGDFLISVNGLNVSKLPHETVVQLIGNSFGSIRMQIAENYYSDSTDEENAATGGIPTLPSMGPSRPRYVYHKTKQQRMRHLPHKKNFESPLSRSSVSVPQQAKKPSHPMLKPPVSIEKAMEPNKRPLQEPKCSEPTASSSIPSQHASALANVRAMMESRCPAGASLEYRAVVGYLGTIEMPKQIANSSKLQTVRSCIRKLRQEKRQPSMVLMIILPDCLKLQANNGKILATYPSSRLNYVSSSSESENRFFGLVTSAVYSPHLDECDDDDEVDDDHNGDQNANPIENNNREQGDSLRRPPIVASTSIDNNVIVSNSCHVFVVDTKLCEHHQHLVKAQEFCIECTKDPISNLCLEFPNNSEYVVNLIRSMYTMRIIPPIAQRSISDDPALHAARNNNGSAAHSPQPSNHSEISTTTSNSDSGIGYNNDCSNVTDRIVLVDFPAQHVNALRIGQSAGAVGGLNRPQNIFQQNISEEAPSTSSKRPLLPRSIVEPKVPYNLNGSGRSLMVSRSCDDVLNLIEQEAVDNSNDLNAITATDVIQPCYASMDDISLHTASMDNEDNLKYPLKQPGLKLGPISPSLAEVDKNQNPEKRKSLKLTIEAWNSLQNINAQEEIKESLDITSSKLASTPDLSRPDLCGNISPFERGWIQTSLRTPRSDKHTINLAMANQEDKKLQHSQASQYKSPGISRSASMSNSERSSFKKKLSQGDKSKGQKKGPTAWGTSIETLLDDAAGLKTFAEFLKLEYAAENIYFWTACERFRNLETEMERQTEALNIYKKHLSNGSLEPVNVDSQARSIVERNLSSADPDLFHPAQKQIFNLMKFDSYQRFLRSDLYKQCLQAEKKGKSLPFTGDNLDDLLKTTNFSESASLKLKKSASNAEEGRPRRSLLPWHRKTRSKSRDQMSQDVVKEQQYPQPPPPPPSVTMKGGNNAIHGSTSSLTSFEALTFGNNITANDLNYSLCRIKFPDGATTMVQLRTQETVAELVQRLMEKRSIQYPFFDVSIKGPPSKSVDLKTPAKELSGKEVEIEQRIAFKLDLPTPKVISVKSKPRKQLYEVVRPILQRYHINPELVEVLMRDTQLKVDLTQLVTAVNDQRLQVVYKKSLYPSVGQNHAAVPHRKAPSPKTAITDGTQTSQNTLDEITNKVFSDLMQVKQNQEDGTAVKTKFDQRSTKSDECPSETSSFFKLRRGKRDSINATGRNNSKKPQQTTLLSSSENKNNLNKIKTGIKLPLPGKVLDKKDDLLEDLKRAQLARLEDQRGTEINFELPEFLKTADNLNKNSGDSSPMQENNMVVNHENTMPSIERPPQPAPRHSITNKTKLNKSISPMKVDEETQDQRSPTQDNTEFTTPSKGPPPLPPKPKVLPIKPSNWGVNIAILNKMSPTLAMPPSTPNIASPQLTNVNVVAVPPSSNSSPNARCAYLDQPSSSFV
ncbi:regulator of G protein signaling family member locomotion defects [Haematobia irritans]|uniref:regulator of G protein signaling family member locomotion defects n=1 Tax=Haematobia irritans TaxID=7368 RepID=UPI003F4F4E1C